MFAEIHYPENLLPEDLDKYLARGWFRMRQTIFTTNFLHFNQQFYSAIWLRIALDDSIHDRKYNALRKLNKEFRAEIKKSCINSISAEHEALYQSYSQTVAFEVSTSLHELLIGKHAYNRFNTHEINIYDGGKMIAAGFFDLGKTSAAGITCIYHEEYKKYSLGKYLMYLKMDFCKQQRLQYFYPGYVVPGYVAFDYKLEIGKNSLQYLQLATQKWTPYDPPEPLVDPLQEMCAKLSALQSHLEGKVSSVILYYKFFEVNLDPYYNGSELFDFPVFLYCFPSTDTAFYTIIVYDVCACKYRLLQCGSLINIGFQQQVNEIFDSNLLKIEKALFQTPSPNQMNAYLSVFLNKP